MAGKREKADAKSARFNMFISPEELVAIDDWSFARRIRSKSEAIRRLVQIGIRYDRDAQKLLDLEKRVADRIAVLSNRLLDAKGGADVDLEAAIQTFLETAVPAQLALSLALSTLLQESEGLREDADVSQIVNRADAYRQGADAWSEGTLREIIQAFEDRRK